jgi:hypothetical protein
LRQDLLCDPPPRWQVWQCFDRFELDESDNIFPDLCAVFLMEDDERLACVAGREPDEW